jgi:hypothetical protein
VPEHHQDTTRTPPGHHQDTKRQPRHARQSRQDRRWLASQIFSHPTAISETARHSANLTLEMRSQKTADFNHPIGIKG